MAGWMTGWLVCQYYKIQINNCFSFLFLFVVFRVKKINVQSIKSIDIAFHFDWLSIEMRKIRSIPHLKR